MPINGKNIASGPGLGAAYILHKTGPDALALLAQGSRVRQVAHARAAAATQKQAEQIGKAHREDLTYKTDSGQLFQQSFDDHTANAVDVLTNISR